MIFCENPNGKYPCGKCRACKLAKANKKMIISVYAAHEYKKNGQFLTLTYDDDHLPNGLKHEDFAGFMKRLRRNTGVNDLKMFMAGEYGEESGREHFHVLFYNHKFPIEEIQKAWSEPYTRIPLGFVADGTLTPLSMKYATGYVAKGGYDPGSGKRPPYGRFSCRIPDGMTMREIERMCRTGKVMFNGISFSVPEIYRRRYKKLWDDYHDQREYDRFLKEQEDIKKNGYMTRKRYLAAIASVKAKMDERDIRLAAKKSEKLKKRLQRVLKKRIMYIMYSLIL